MMLRDIGILGTGLWDGPVIDNQRFGADFLGGAQNKEPFRGRRADDGTVRIAGLSLSPDRHARTIREIERSFSDGFRGTRRRRRFPDDLLVSAAESEAAGKAIADAGLAPADIDAILVQSFLPDQLQPKNAGLLAHNLGITRASAWELDSLCNSALTQAQVAAALIHSGQARSVLCTQSIAYSRISNPGTSATLIDGDMASAYVVGRVPGGHLAFSWRTDGRLHDAFQLRWGVPADAGPRGYWQPSQERMIVHHDEELQALVMSEIARHVTIVCGEALARAEMRLDEIEVFISHQPLSWFSAFMEDTLGLKDGIALNTFEEYASVNSCSITVSIHEARRTGRIRRGTRALFFGPATGNVYGAAAVRF